MRLETGTSRLFNCPEVSVTVGGTVYLSIPTTYEVSDIKNPINQSFDQVIFRLEPFVEFHSMN